MKKPANALASRAFFWLRGQDLNLRPSGYEPDHRQLEIRPICTPELPSSHTSALDFFLAGEAYDLIAADDHGSGAGMCGKDEESNRGIGSRDRRKMRHVVKAVARTVAYRCRQRSMSSEPSGWLGPVLFDAHLGVSSVRREKFFDDRH